MSDGGIGNVKTIDGLAARFVLQVNYLGIKGKGNRVGARSVKTFAGDGAVLVVEAGIRHVGRIGNGNAGPAVELSVLIIGYKNIPRAKAPIAIAAVEEGFWVEGKIFEVGRGLCAQGTGEEEGK